MSTARQAAMYSPSVTLEKGAYRMRAPPRPRATSLLNSKARVDVLATNRRHLAMLIVLLTSATLTCFGVAYYLYSTRWDTRAATIPHHIAQADHPLQVLPYDPDGALLDRFAPGAGDRFLSYLPHSGFHNQRIAFENALVFSRLLNRTLLVPPVRLGRKPLRYVKYDRLLQFLVRSGKEGLRHCARVPAHLFLPPECEDYFDYTHVPWHWLADLTEIKTQQNLIERWNMTDAWIRDRLHIGSKDILKLEDSGPYDYRFLDTAADDSKTSNIRYLESIDIPTLALSDARLLQIGTLFGSSRLRLRDPDNINIRREIRGSMAFSNEALSGPADAIHEALGGAYLGAHIRVGDGHFQADGEKNTRLIWWKLVSQVFKIQAADALALERSLGLDLPGDEVREPHIAPDLAAARTPHPPLPPLPDRPLSQRHCRGSLHTLPHLLPLNNALYISTDAPDPLSTPVLARFLRTFPCTYFLSDFRAQTASLGRVQNAWDGAPMRGFLEPFLDAMVVGRAARVVGTDGSTFSRFVEDVLWRRYHGWDIVLRG